jgi:hypothetical protein
MMPHSGKTLATLMRLKSHLPQQVDTAHERQSQKSDELSPLKPQEASDSKLAEFFQDHDFSFLFEPQELNGSFLDRRRRDGILPPPESLRHTAQYQLEDMQFVEERGNQKRLYR